jgi:hypothetical protein
MPIFENFVGHIKIRMLDYYLWSYICTEYDVVHVILAHPYLHVTFTTGFPVYSKTLFSQCNLTPEIEQIPDKLHYLGTS